MRKLNLNILSKWLSDNGPLAKEDLCHLARIRFYTLDKILREERKVSELEQIALCNATGFSKDELFPIAKKQTA
jgi:hypothetical protein